MIKVENIQKYNILQDYNNVNGVLNRLVTPAKLMLVECKPEEALLLTIQIIKTRFVITGNDGGGGNIGYHEQLKPLQYTEPRLITSTENMVEYQLSGKSRDICIWFIPIFISESEKIENGDIAYYANKLGGGKFLVKAVDTPYGRVYHKLGVDPEKEYGHIQGGITPLQDEVFKVVALPEHYSPELIQMIADSKLKNRDNVLIECESEDKYSESYLKGLKIHKIKLNPHITIYPVKEEKLTYQEWFEKYRDQLLGIPKENPTEKMVPLSLLEKAFDAGYDRALFVSGGEDTDLSGKIPLSKNEWFEQNVK